MNTVLEDNVLTLSGRIATDLEFYHESYGEKFYLFTLEVARTSGAIDSVPVVISGKICETCSKGSNITINGQVRTFSKYESEGKRKLMLYAFVKDFELITEQQLNSIKKTNEILIRGKICNKPSYRVTPKGREVSDMLLTVERAYDKLDFIPTILWGRNARLSNKLKDGDSVEIIGRFQSRDYIKKKDDCPEGEKRIAYEISATQMKTF